MDTSHLFLDLTSCLITKPKTSFKNPYFPILGPSPLRKEYKVPGAWPEETTTRDVDVPETYVNVAARSEAMHYEVCTSSSRLYSSPPTPPKSCLSERSEILEDEHEDPEDYGPEYATYLVATMLAQHETEQRRENGALYRIQCMTKKERYVEDETRQWLGENLVRGDVRRAMRGQDRMTKASEDKKRWMRDGWERDGRMDTTFTMGEGTPENGGHERMQSYFVKQAWKRKREVEDDGGVLREEMRLAKRVRRVPRGILKRWLMMGERHVAAESR